MPRDLSISFNKLGDLARSAGDPDAARRYLRRFPEYPQAPRRRRTGKRRLCPRDLSISFNKLGDIARAGGDIVAARAAHQASLDIITRLAAMDAGNAQWQADLRFTQGRLDDLRDAE